MKVLYVTNIPSPYRVDFFNELGKQCELTVIFERESASDRNQNWKAEAFESFKAIFLNGKMLGTDASISFGVCRYLTKDYDAIILGSYSSPTDMIAVTYMRRHHIPFYLNADGGFIKQDKWYVRKLKTHFISKATWWLSTSEDTTKYLIHYGAQQDKIYEYPFTSIKELDRYMPSTEEKIRIRQELGLQEKYIAITVGQYIHRKGNDLLLKAAAETPRDIGYYLIGGIPDQEYMELAEKAGKERIHFLSFMQKEQLRKYYLAADVFILPTREDIWGLVVNEAIGYGLPVIGSEHALAVKTLVHDNENGYVITPEDIDDFANVIERTVNSKEMLEYFADSSYCKSSEYTIEYMAKRHINIITNMR